MRLASKVFDSSEAPGESSEPALGSGGRGGMVMRVLIGYESIYGSNRKIAHAVAAAGGSARSREVQLDSVA
jgi:hypothetical protein